MALTAGSRLGPYEIRGAIGSGGMAEVYRAHDPRLGRDVALKLLPEAMAKDAEGLERFTREARAVAALNHPHIVTIHSTEEAGGVRFMTMELIEGRTLAEMIPTEGMSLAQFFKISAALADALSAAHGKGITHRDMKPLNVMLTSSGHVKVLDFGLARSAENDHTEGPGHEGEETKQRLTQAGMVVGTAPYMSPEQVEGRALDGRSDLFSLGIMMYQMLSGARPFQGQTTPALMSSILKDCPRAVRDLRRDLPDGVSRLVSRCLEKDPAHRFQTSPELLAALRSEEGAWSSATAGARAGGAGGPSVAVLPFADMSAAKDQDFFCEGMAEEIMNALGHVEGVRVASRTSTFKASRDSGDLGAIARALSVDHILEGSVRTLGSRLRVTARFTDVAKDTALWSEKYDREMTDLFAIQDEIATSVVDAIKARLAKGGQGVPQRAQVKNLEAYRSFLQGRFQRHTKNNPVLARQAYEEATRLDPEHGMAWIGVAETCALSVHYGLLRADDGCARAREALARAERLQGDTPEAQYVLAFMSFIEHRWRDLETGYRRVLEQRPHHVSALGSFGAMLGSRNRLEEARPLLDRCREADPLAAFPCAMTGLSHVAAGRPEEGLRYLEDALAFEPDHVTSLWVSGIACVGLGRVPEAITRFARGLEVTRRSAFFAGLLGWAHAVAGHEGDARSLLAELHARPEDAPRVGSDIFLLAALGETEPAFAALERARSEFQPFVCYPNFSGFDPMRSDARFAGHLAALELDQPPRH
jgi:TolB-like protein